MTAVVAVQSGGEIYVCLVFTNNFTIFHFSLDVGNIDDQCRIKKKDHLAG